MTYGNVNVDTVTTSTPNGILGAGNASIMKNRIINGAMVIDQRNAGASVTPADTQYIVDRFQLRCSQASKFTAQQNAGSVTPPLGYTNYLGFTVASAVTIGSSDYFMIRQQIEGYNIADLGWGTASAKTVTLSFWVYSSLTGTFGGALQNGSNNRVYPYSYTVSSANTWTQVSVTIAGDTSGTWTTNNGTGIYMNWGLGVGSSLSGTAGAWSGTANIFSATGATSVVGTSGATFYITGVQLEVGSSATGFEYRQYTTELQLCQRYCPAWTTSGTNIPLGSGGQCITTSLALLYLPYMVTPRTTPTGITASGSTAVYQAGSGVQALSSLIFNTSSTSVMQLLATASSATLIAGNATTLLATSSTIIGTGCEL